MARVPPRAERCSRVPAPVIPIANFTAFDVSFRERHLKTALKNRKRMLWLLCDNVGKEFSGRRRERGGQATNGKFQLNLNAAHGDIQQATTAGENYF